MKIHKTIIFQITRAKWSIILFALNTILEFVFFLEHMITYLHHLIKQLYICSNLEMERRRLPLGAAAINVMRNRESKGLPERI